MRKILFLLLLANTTFVLGQTYDPQAAAAYANYWWNGRNTQKDNKMQKDAIFSTDIVQKNELNLTPEITEMVVNHVSSRLMNRTDEELSNFGVKNRSQLMNLQLEQPIPMYMIDFDNENLKFIDIWRVPIMSNGEPILLTNVRLADDGHTELLMLVLLKWQKLFIIMNTKI